MILHGFSQTQGGICWVWPLPSKSDHQDYSIFSRESLQTFICHWHPGKGPHPRDMLASFPESGSFN